MPDRKADGFEPLRRNRFLRYVEVAVGHSTPFQRGTDRLFELVQFPTIGYKSWQVD